MVRGAAQRSVVIIHEHGLLGEGLAQYLLTTGGLRARAVSATDARAVKRALAARPAVVVYESNGPGRSYDLGALCPGAVLIDVSAVFSAGLAASPGDLLARIVEALHRSSARPA